MDRMDISRFTVHCAKGASPKIKLEEAVKHSESPNWFGSTHCFLSCFFTYSTRDKGIQNSGVGGACLHRRKRTYALSSKSFSGGFPAKRETSASLIWESSMV